MWFLSLSLFSLWCGSIKVIIYDLLSCGVDDDDNDEDNDDVDDNDVDNDDNIDDNDDGNNDDDNVEDEASSLSIYYSGQFLDSSGKNIQLLSPLH